MKNNRFAPLLFALLIFFIILILTVPKVYFANQVYYLSKDINKLYNQYLSLKEEQIALKQRLENKKLSNTINNSKILLELEGINE